MEAILTDLITNMIQYPSNGGTTPGYLARPTYAGPHRGVVVIQEWWGLVPHIEEVARRLARNGFVALAPDLYHGKVAEEPDEAQKLAMSMDRNRAIKEIASAAKYLKGLDQVQPKWVGVVGWCMGGGLAISASAYSGDFAAAVAFYGRPLDANEVPRIQAPLLALYGEQDHSIPQDWVKQFDEQLDSYHLPHEIVTYPNAGHAFFNESRTDHYNEDAARDGWNRTLAWLRTHLG
jgi:carboxymethylenebutenolidase